MYPVVLADGSIFMHLVSVNTTETGAGLWTQTTGFHRVQLAGPLFQSIRQILRSGDRNHVFMSGADSGGAYGRYDLSTGTVTSKTVAFGSQPFLFAVNQDGSRILIKNDCCGLVLGDSNFNTLASANASSPTGAVATADFSRIYLLNDIPARRIDVLDGTNLKTIGSIPTLLQSSNISTIPRTLDGTGRILATAQLGLAAIDTSPTPIPSLAPAGIRVGPSPYNNEAARGRPRRPAALDGHSFRTHHAAVRP